MPRAKINTDAENYQARIEATQTRSRRESLSVRDIGKIPRIKNPIRRNRCKFDLKRFLKTYHANSFRLDFSPDHDKYIERLQRIVLNGGLSAIAMPRGGGKTTIAEFTAQWAIFYGHRKYVPILGATDVKATNILDDIKTSCETNEMLQDDFPEVLYPIKRIERIAHRCKGQMCCGVPTRIEWTSDRLVFPTIKGSKASGSVLLVFGITGAFRGEKTLLPDGSVIRPDFCIIDDPQTAETAKSVEQCKDRIAIIRGDVLGLAGPDQKIAAVMPCTVIRKDDLADQMLDRQKHPEWQGHRTKMVNRFPDKDSEGAKLWDQYAEVRRESLRREDEGREATAFYEANRIAMDDGFEVSWNQRFVKGELSAQQHAMNLRLDNGDAAFFSEYNNDPLEVDNDIFKLTIDQICSKVNMRPRGSIPLSCQKLVSFIDVQQEALFWVVMAVEPGFTCYVVDYGTFPDQQRRNFARRDLPHTFTDKYPSMGGEARIHAGLDEFTKILLPKEWKRDDGASMKIDRCLIDANWGKMSRTIYNFCRMCQFSVVMPSHGKYIGAATTPMGHWRRKEGTAVGDNWIVDGATKNRFLRHIVFDTNHWKTFLAARLTTSIGDPGCLSFFGSTPGEHHLIAEHCVSETAETVIHKDSGRKVQEWRLKTEKPDNDWWDCLVGCMVACSHVGTILQTIKQVATPRPPVKRVTREAMYL